MHPLPDICPVCESSYNSLWPCNFEQWLDGAKAEDHPNRAVPLVEEALARVEVGRWEILT